MSAPFILGIDTGFSTLGWAAVELAPEGPILREVGLLRTKPGEAARLKSEDNVARARLLWRGLADLERFAPRAIAIESQSWPRNAGAVAKIGITWGLVTALAEVWRVPLVHASPQQIKRDATGRRDASKDDVLEGLRNKPGFTNIHDLLEKAGVTRSMWEHPTDAAASVFAALDTEIIRAIWKAAA